MQTQTRTNKRQALAGEHGDAQALDHVAVVQLARLHIVAQHVIRQPVGGARGETGRGVNHVAGKDMEGKAGAGAAAAVAATAAPALSRAYPAMRPMSFARRYHWSAASNRP